jgi:ATP-dependent DNA ligase
MPSLPFITPMLASLCPEPFDHANWLFELKHDGFRAIAFIEDGHCRVTFLLFVQIVTVALDV